MPDQNKTVYLVLSGEDIIADEPRHWCRCESVVGVYSTLEKAIGHIRESTGLYGLPDSWPELKEVYIAPKLYYRYTTREVDE
jgi:hypothetical protein